MKMSDLFRIVDNTMYIMAGADLNLNANSILDEDQPRWWQILKSGAVESVVLTAGITDVPEFAFSALRAIQHVKLPDTLVNIGAYAFANCVGLRTIDIPKSVRSIGECAFDGSGLTSIRVPATVEHIGPYAFHMCEHLAYAHVEAVREISDGMFSNCFMLKSVRLDDGIVVVGDHAFEGTPLRTIEVPSSTEYIGKCLAGDGTVVTMR